MSSFPASHIPRSVKIEPDPLSTAFPKPLEEEEEKKETENSQ
jgi:hypothetical protein